MSPYDLTPVFHLDSSGIADPVLKEFVRQVRVNFRETYVTIADVTPATSKGSIPVGDGSKPVALPVGLDGQVLTSESTKPLGVFWEYPVARPGIVLVAANYAVDPTVGTVLVDASAGPVTITLPSAAPPSRTLHIKKIDSGGHMVRIQGLPGEDIDGKPYKTTDKPYTSMTVQSFGSDWWII